MPKKNKQFVVIGLGRFGNSIATTLYSMGHDVLAIDKDLELVEDIAEQVTHAVRLDATDEAAFKAIGPSQLRRGHRLHRRRHPGLDPGDHALQGAGRALRAGQGHGRAARQGALPGGGGQGHLPERDMGVRVAHNLVTTNILEYIELSQDYSLVEIEVPKAWNGQTMRELNLRVRYGINVVAIRHPDGGITVSPMGSDALSAGDVLIAVGSVDAINKLDDLSVRG